MKTKRLTKVTSFIIIAAFLAVMVFPFFWILITSFKPSSEIFGKSTAFHVIANNPTLVNFQAVLDKGILNSVKNSFIVATITTIYVVSVATLSAYILARVRFKGKGIVLAIILSVSMFPQMVVVGPIFNMFYKLDMLNSYFVTLAYSSITLPAAVWIMVAHFKRIPLSIEEAASIDGCSQWKTLWKVIFPI